MKLLSVLSAGMLLACTQLSPAPTLGEPITTSSPSSSRWPRVQPVTNISSPVSEVEGLFIMGRSAQGAGQLALAEERYAQVLSKQPSHLGALNSIAVIYAQTERTDKALQFFRRALELDPQAPYVHNNLGYALLVSGRLAEAEAELKLARDLSPSNLKIQKNLELLTQTKERSAALAGVAARELTTISAAPGQQLVVVGPHVYELLEVPAILPKHTKVSTPTGARTVRSVRNFSTSQN